MDETKINEILSKIDIMKQIVTGFINVVSKENEALKNNNVNGVRALYEQKLKTIAAYRSMSAYFIKNSEIISSFASPEKEDLKELSKDRIVLMVSHSLADANKYADRIIELSSGKIINDYIRNIDYCYECQLKNYTNGRDCCPKTCNEICNCTSCERMSER